MSGLWTLASNETKGELTKMKKGAPQNKHGQPYSKKQKKASRFMNRFSTFQKRESSGPSIEKMDHLLAGGGFLAAVMSMFGRGRRG